MNFQGYISESPDIVPLAGSSQLHWEDADARPFFYLKGKLYLGNFRQNHGELLADTLDVLLPPHPTKAWEIMSDLRAKHAKDIGITGRIWMAEKVISFWNPDKLTPDQLRKVASDLRSKWIDITGWQFDAWKQPTSGTLNGLDLLSMTPTGGEKKKPRLGPITESLNRPYPWTKKESFFGYRYKFQTDAKIRYEVSMDDVDDMGEWEVSFSAQTPGKHETIYATGTGDEFRVFATIAGIVRDFLKTVDPREFSFSGKLNEPSRVRLYRTFAEMIKRDFGYSYKVLKDVPGEAQMPEVNFKFSKFSRIDK